MNWWGAFSAPDSKSGRGGLERGCSFYRLCIPAWVHQAEKVEKPAKSGLTNIDLLMEVSLIRTSRIFGESVLLFKHALDAATSLIH